MKVYQKLFKYLSKKEGMGGYLSIVVSAISSILLVYGYYLIYCFLEEIIVRRDLNGGKSYAVRIAAVLTISGTLYISSAFLSHMTAFRLETRLRKKGIDGLLNASFRFYDLHSSGLIRKTIDDNAAKTHMAVAHMLPDNSRAFLVPLLLLVLAFIVSVPVGIIIFVLSIVCAVILKGMMGNGEFMKLYQESLTRMSSETVEYIRGMQVVKIFGAKVEAFRSLYDAIQDYSHYAYEYSISCKRPYVLYQWIFIGIIPILLIPGSFFLIGKGNANEIAVELLMVFFLSGIMMVSFMKIMWASMNIFNANYAVDSLEELYQQMLSDQLLYGEKEYIDHYNIEFDHVSFSYNDNKVLDKLSFTLAENKSYALVGPSGSGKSTVAKLISGFYNVDGGAIKIGGIPLQEYRKETIIREISFVFQDSKLFKMSLYDNVALANSQASHEEVMEAMKLAGCEEIINKFPQKEHTLIGAKGVYLSGGEKQRIAIARAILKKSKIIIMDEASASIDADNEYELQKAFQNLMKDKTVIMIAHRLTSIQALDEILVLDHGKIVERGTSAELLERQGLYRKLYDNYHRANEWRVEHD